MKASDVTTKEELEVYLDYCMENKPLSPAEKGDLSVLLANFQDLDSKIMVVGMSLLLPQKLSNYDCYRLMSTIRDITRPRETMYRPMQIDDLGNYISARYPGVDRIIKDNSLSSDKVYFNIIFKPHESIADRRMIMNDIRNAFEYHMPANVQFEVNTDFGEDLEENR